jgi:hypothetical protein
MLGTAKGDGLLLPKFQRNAKQRRHIASEKRTSNLIRALWNAAGQRQRNEPAFLKLLVQLGWTNGGAPEAVRRWRNRKLAEYLQIPYTSEQELAEELHLKFRSMPSKRWQAMLMEGTGITWYFNPFRPETLSFVTSHSKTIARAFKQVFNEVPECVREGPPCSESDSVTWNPSYRWQVG